MNLELSHGRMQLDEDMDDWGFDGPVLLSVHSVEQRYGTAIVRFASVAAAARAQKLTGWDVWDFNPSVLEIRKRDDLIETIEPGSSVPRFYGDYLVRDEPRPEACDEMSPLARRAIAAIRGIVDRLDRLSRGAVLAPRITRGSRLRASETPQG
jgi:hypothetical protein